MLLERIEEPESPNSVTEAGSQPWRVLERVAIALNSTLELREVLQSLAELVLETSGADRCSLFLLEGPILRPAVAIGIRSDEDLWGAFRAMGPIDLTRIPNGSALLEAGRALPIEDAAGSELVPRTWVQRFSLRSLVLVPLTAAGEPCGLMVVDYRRPRRFDEGDVRLLEAIGSSAGVAVRNARLYEDARAAAAQRAVVLAQLEQQLRHLRILNELSVALVEGADSHGLAERLNGLLCGDGIEVTGMAFRDRTLSRRLRGDSPTAAERAMWRSGRESAEIEDGARAVPIRVGRRCVGSLRVQPADLDAVDMAFVNAIARGVGDVTMLGALRSAVEEAARDRAVAAERDRIAADLHSSVGEIFVGLGLLVRRLREELPADSPWSERLDRTIELADRGKWEVDQSVRALSFVPAARRGIVPAVKALARSIEADGGLPVIVDVQGRPVRLNPRIERALYRVAHQAMSNAWRHSRCSAIRVEICFSGREVLVRVVDDGVGLETRTEPGTTGFGLGGMRRAMDAIDGSFRVQAGRPRGVVVEARAGKEPR